MKFFLYFIILVFYCLDIFLRMKRYKITGKKNILCTEIQLLHLNEVFIQTIKFKKI